MGGHIPGSMSRVLTFEKYFENAFPNVRSAVQNRLGEHKLVTEEHGIPAVGCSHKFYAPQTKILEGLTKEEIRIFDVL